MNRRTMLARAAGAGMAAAVTGVPSLAPATADTGSEALDAALSALVTLELTSVEAYDLFVGTGIASAQTRAAFARCREQDRGHAHRLRVIMVELGTEPPPAPNPADIPALGSTTTETGALQLAISLERQTISAYMATVRMIGRRDLGRSIYGAINSNAQQLVVLRQLAGESPVPSAFESGG